MAELPRKTLESVRAQLEEDGKQADPSDVVESQEEVVQEEPAPKRDRLTSQEYIERMQKRREAGFAFRQGKSTKPVQPKQQPNNRDYEPQGQRVDEPRILNQAAQNGAQTQVTSKILDRNGNPIVYNVYTPAASAVIDVEPEDIVEANSLSPTVSEETGFVMVDAPQASVPDEPIEDDREKYAEALRAEGIEEQFIEEALQADRRFRNEDAFIDYVQELMDKADILAANHGYSETKLKLKRKDVERKLVALGIPKDAKQDLDILYAKELRDNYHTYSVQPASIDKALESNAELQQRAEVFLFPSRSACILYNLRTKSDWMSELVQQLINSWSNVNVREQVVQLLGISRANPQSMVAQLSAWASYLPDTYSRDEVAGDVWKAYAAYRISESQPTGSPLIDSSKREIIENRNSLQQRLQSDPHGQGVYAEMTESGFAQGYPMQISEAFATSHYREQYKKPEDPTDSVGNLNNYQAAPTGEFVQNTREKLPEAAKVEFDSGVQESTEARKSGNTGFHPFATLSGAVAGGIQKFENDQKESYIQSVMNASGCSREEAEQNWLDKEAKKEAKKEQKQQTDAQAKQMRQQNNGYVQGGYGGYGGYGQAGYGGYGMNNPRGFGGFGRRGQRNMYGGYGGGYGGMRGMRGQVNPIATLLGIIALNIILVLLMWAVRGAFDAVLGLVAIAIATIGFLQRQQSGMMQCVLKMALGYIAYILIFMFLK